MRYTPGLNQLAPLGDRLRDALVDASRLDLAVAYVQTSGVVQLLTLLPRATRAVMGLGFGLSDPRAIETLAERGADVRLVVDSPSFSSSSFHPKLYLIEFGAALTVLSASANLTAGGLRDNDRTPFIGPPLLRVRG